MVRAISISPDERTVAFGCKDNRIRIYSLEDYVPCTILKPIPCRFLRCNIRLMGNTLYREAAMPSLISGTPRTIACIKPFRHIYLPSTALPGILTNLSLPLQAGIKRSRSGMKILNLKKH